MCPFSRVLKVIRGLIALLPGLLHKLKKNLAWNQSGNPSIVLPPQLHTKTTAVGQVAAFLGKRRLTLKPRRAETLPMWSQRKIIHMNTWTTMPHTANITTETRPTAAMATDTGSLATALGTRVESRTTTNATSKGAGINLRIVTVTRKGKWYPREGVRLASGIGTPTSANDRVCSCPQILCDIILKQNLWGLHCNHLWPVLYIGLLLLQ